MSNNDKDVELDCEVEKKCGAVDLIIKPKEKDLGGFSVRRAIPSIHRKMIGPWIFFDHMGPAKFEANNGISVRPHPHIGIATVTYLFEGEILHRDSLGSLKAIQPGDVNLMVAGNGITHSERESDEVNSVPHSLHGFQLWMALPVDMEETNPAFHHYPAKEIPEVVIDNIKIRLIMGSAFGITSPVKTFSETLYFEATLQKGFKLVLPKTEELGFYVAKGALKIKDTDLLLNEMAIVDNCEIEIVAQEDTKIVVIGGENIGKRYIDWNFVSSKKERIEKAKRDWQDKKFDVVVGDENDFIPLPKY